MAFDVPGDAYDRFMGRFSGPLAEPFADFASVTSESAARVLDVGCGPGALTALLVERVGPDRVSAVDPSAPFVAAASARLPGVDVRRAAAEALPFADGGFDVVLAQLVVQFMTDAPRGIAEMARVCAEGGVVAVCVWDHAGGRGPLSPFWSAAADLDPAAPDESTRVGTGQGQLATLLTAAGLQAVAATELTVTLRFTRFEDWWEPFTLGVGTVGDYVGTLAADSLAALRQRCAELLGPPPFIVDGVAWAARGRRRSTP